MEGLVIGFLLFNAGLLLINWAMETHRTGLPAFLGFVYGAVSTMAGGMLIAGSLFLMAVARQ